MSYGILLKGGDGGIGSDEVTAKRAQILTGYTALTADSSDEVVGGTMPILAGASYSPQTYAQSYNCAGHYMSGNVSLGAASGIQLSGTMWLAWLWAGWGPFSFSNEYLQMSSESPPVHTRVDISGRNANGYPLGNTYYYIGMPYSVNLGKVNRVLFRINRPRSAGSQDHRMSMVVSPIGKGANDGGATDYTYLYSGGTGESVITINVRSCVSQPYAVGVQSAYSGWYVTGIGVSN